MQVKETNREYYDQAYGFPEDFRAYWRQRLSFDQHYKSALNWYLLSFWLKEGHPVRQVLEIGFGFGLTLERFPRGVFLCGTEISQHAAYRFSLQCARHRRQALICVNDSVGALPFHTRFDVIICSHVLEHVPDDVAMLNEFRRLLAPTGVLL